MKEILEPAVGCLLVAAVAMEQDFFTNSVIYLVDHDQDGSLGVVLNKYADISLESVLPEWVDLVSWPKRLFSGGPVSSDGAICLARTINPNEEPLGWRRISEHIGLLHLDTPVELAQGAFSDLRIYAGYAGWSPGQLVQKIEQGSWHLFKAHDEDVFTNSPEGLWRRVLRRQGGSLSLISTWAKNPDLN